MNGASLLTLGDPLEQCLWPALGQHFPLYEEFWQRHIVTLRDAHGRVRDDIDERLELMAQEHYKCLVSLGIAHDGLNDETHPQRTFSSLQNAGNRARQVVGYFNDIRSECIPANPDPIDPEIFAEFCRDIARYRNYVHEDVMGMIEHQQRRYLPKPEKLATYRRWSRLRNSKLADFELLSDILEAQFDRLKDLLNQHWRMMLDRSPDVLASPRYAQLLPSLSTQIQISQPIVLSSNVQLG